MANDLAWLNWRRWLLLCLSGLLGACAGPGALTLYGVGHADPKQPRAYAQASAEQASQGLRILRNGQPLAVTVPMTLATGDVVETLPSTAAVIRFPEGHEATLLPNTRVTLGSIWADFGEFFVRIFTQPQDSFKVQTQYVTAGVEGTEFWVRVDRESHLSLGVVEGRVSLSSRSNKWQPLKLGPDEVASVSRDGPPTRELRESAAVDAIVQLMKGSFFRPMPAPPPPPPPPPTPTPGTFR